MRNLNWWNKFIFWVNVFLAIILFLSSLSSKLEPSSARYIFLLGLAYPLFLSVNVLFFLYWIYKRKIHFVLSLVVILFGISNLTTLLATNLGDKTSTASDFTLMSFNVRLFNKYKWIEVDDLNDSIFKYIESKSPDVIAFQEFTNRDKPGFQNIKRMEDLGYKYHEVEPGGIERPNDRFFGLATFSKYKIINNGAAFQYDLVKGSSYKTACFYTDIEINGSVVRVYNTHLYSLKFVKEDYEFVENVSENNEKQAVEKSKGIASKVLTAAYKRAEEIKSIKSHIDQCPYPSILVGDFNEPPYTYSYHQLTTNLSDAFLVHGFGIGTTFDGISTIPGLRLDFMLYSENIVSTHFNVGKSGLSDHRPLLGGFSISK